MAFKLENTKLKQKTNHKSSDTMSFLKKDIQLFTPTFSNKIKEDFYTELSVLLNAGVSLKESLELIEKTQKKETIQQKINAINYDVVMGKSLSLAIKKQKHFTDYEYYSIKIGEETGTLSKVCEQLGSFFTQKNEQRRNLVSALTYPAIILSTAVLVVIFMLQYVVPMFQDIFEQQGIDLPQITKLIIKASEFLNNYGWLLLFVFVSLFIFQSYLFKRKKFKVIKDNLVAHIPFVGNFIKTIYLSQFTQAVALLISSKVPMLNSIQLVKRMVAFYPLQQALQIVEEELLKGVSLSKALSKHALFNDKMIALIRVAEETNQTEFIFERLHNQYNTQVQQQSKMLSTLMEPFIILFVGILVGVILVAMYLPMFKLSSVIG